MRIRALLIAVSILTSGAAFAASDRAGKTSSTPAAAVKHEARHVKQKARHAKRHVKQHARHAKRHVNHPDSHAKAGRRATHHAASRQSAPVAPQTNVSDTSREARINEALTRYRQQRG